MVIESLGKIIQSCPVRIGSILSLNPREEEGQKKEGLVKHVKCHRTMKENKN